MFLALGGAVLSSIGFLGTALIRAVQPPTMEFGIFRFIDIENCRIEGNCFFQNSISPYGRSLFPPTPDLSALDVAVGATVLLPNQAIVWIGKTPPSEYWSFIPYLWRNTGTSTGTIASEFYGPIIFASLTQGINNFDYPNLDQIAIVMTRNQNVFQRERMRIQTKFPGLTVVPLWIPIEAPLDSLVNYIVRVAFFPRGAQETYVNRPEVITYKNTYSDIGYSPVMAIPSGSCVQVPLGVLPLYLKPLPKEPSEFCYQDLFDAYVAKIKKQYRVIREIRVVNFSEAVGLEQNYQSGLQCIVNNVLCQGDNPTAGYVASVPFELGANESILVVAINHRLTQRCFYTSINLYEEEVALGINSTIPLDTELFYYHIWSPGAGEYRTIERSYVQLPENVAPDTSTMLSFHVFIIPLTTPSIDIENPDAPLNVNLPGFQVLAEAKKMCVKYR